MSTQIVKSGARPEDNEMRAYVIYVEFSPEYPHGKLSPIVEPFDTPKEAIEYKKWFNRQYGDTIDAGPYTRAYYDGTR